MGTKDGCVHIRIFGCFTCAILNINKYLGYYCIVENVHLSEDLNKIFITVKDMQNNIRIVLIDSSIFKTHTKELFSVALKYVKLLDLVTYLKNTITNITETWESFLLEIDHKLSKYAKKVPEGGVTADFLDLLMFGNCSPELEEFLMTDLTKKGLEKFGQTIEMSYANIQKLLLKNVTKFGQNLTYHLSELRGMARLEHRYQVRSFNLIHIISVIIILKFLDNRIVRGFNNHSCTSQWCVFNKSGRNAANHKPFRDQLQSVLPLVVRRHPVHNGRTDPL